MPQNIKIVAGNDLITERNINSPVSITIASIKLNEEENSKKAVKGKLELIDNEKHITSIEKYPECYKEYTYKTVFYGRGKGIHGIEPFTGIPLNYILNQYYPVSPDNIKNGVFEVISSDNYRCLYTYSEVFNRNDQEEVLFVSTEGSDDGKFMLFPGADFFLTELLSL